MAKVYLSPSSQVSNPYAWGSTNEAAQCRRIADAAALVRGHPGAEAPEAFPFLVVALFTLAAAAGMVVHAFERHLELNADRFALRHAGGKEALRECLRLEFEREPFAVEVPAWQEWLLRRRPSALRRLERAEEEAGAR